MRRVTVELLRKLNACEEQVGVFEREWPNGAEVTLDNVRRAQALWLDIEWLVCAEATAPAWKVYEEAFAAAEKELAKALAAAKKGLAKALAAAEKEYDEAIKSAYKAHAEGFGPARKVYEEAFAAAKKIYDEARRASPPNAPAAITVLLGGDARLTELVMVSQLYGEAD